MDPRYTFPGKSSVGWQDAASIPYPEVRVEHHPHAAFAEQQPLGSLSFVPPDSYPYIHAFGIMPQEQNVQTPTQSQTPTQGLPQPQHILPSQTTPKACLACGKVECTLVSHRHFSRHIMSGSSSKSLPIRTHPPAPPAQAHTTGSDINQPIRSENHVPYPLVMDAERQHLLNLWSHEFSTRNQTPERHLIPVRFIDQILPAARSHAPLFQAILALSATSWASANNVIDEVAPRHLTYAVQMLSQACPTEQAASTDEAMLAAILILLIYLAQGNGFEVGKHISGLVHLATMRGGPHYLGLSGIVAEMLMHADAMQAIFFDREPVWKLPLPALDIGPPSRMGRGFQTLIPTNQIDLPLLLAADSLCRAADIFGQAASGKTLPLEVKFAFGYLSTISEYQLAQCNAMYHSSSSRNECLCLALILFNHVILRNNGAISPSIRKVEYRLWTSLEAAETNGILLEMQPTVRLWMLMTGLTASVRGDCQFRAMAIDKMRALRLSAAITGWDTLRVKVLDEFLWLAVVEEEVFRRVWLEVEGIKAMPSRGNG